MLIFTFVLYVFVSEIKVNIFIVSQRKIQSKGREKYPHKLHKKAKTIIKMRSCRTSNRK